MAFLFHQNMRNFGGAAPARNASYTGAFGAIAVGLAGAGGICVGGMTEIVNNGTASVTLSGPAPNLFNWLGLQPAVLAACGITALARGPEFIGIGIAGVALASVGRIFLQASGQAINLIHDIARPGPPSPEWSEAVPPSATPDYRGVVYVVVTSAATGPFGVGFLHNLYTFVEQRILVAGQIPAILALMRANPAMAGGRGHVFLGGDFNVAPIIRGTPRTGIATCYAVGAAPAATPPGAMAGGTTWNGNLYDYWYSDLSPAAPVPIAPGGVALPIPGVATNTLDSGAAGLMSDHAATVLQIV
ncbi:MAG TPA: hypothetical protein VJU77_09655 [Chthoniobacterales bacterium]|nr:hypothetical protein [Chthoniobacterales bacterium]